MRAFLFRLLAALSRVPPKNSPDPSQKFPFPVDFSLSVCYTEGRSPPIKIPTKNEVTTMKKRNESAFGLHFDFHARPESGCVIGATLKEEDIRKICREVKPDFIQIDCKGHPGWASYPSALGNGMPKFEGDPLALWRKVTLEEDIALYMHYSGVWDTNYCSKHPEDAIVGADGKPSEYITRTYGFAYADKLLIPQMKELAGKYKVDGIWVDGECWATALDFHPETLAAFEKETGISLDGKLPTGPDCAYYAEFREFCRECFRRYVRHYTDAVHAEYPDFQIATNWGYTDHMPEKVSAHVDFLSGDLNPWNAYNSARYAGRAIAQQNYTWDLMAWNFRTGDANTPDQLPKYPVQVMQEAATVLAVGGGFQNYITQKPDGSPRMRQALPMKAVGEFIRAREAYAFRGKAVHQAALLMSTYDRGIESAGLYSRNGYEKIVGMTALLCDVGQSLEIVSEHTLLEDPSRYPMIAVPETYSGLEAATVDALVSYAEKGGSLMLVGGNTARLFADRLGITLGEPTPDNGWRYATAGNFYGMLRGAATAEAKEAETLVWFGDNEDEITLPGAIAFAYGKGKVALLAADLGTQYLACAQPIYRDAVKAMADALYTPTVKTEALGLLEIVLAEKEGRRYIHLINGNGLHAGRIASTEDFLPPVLDVTLTVRCDKAPRSLILRPEGRELPFAWEDGTLTVKVDRVDLYDIIEIVE